MRSPSQLTVKKRAAENTPSAAPTANSSRKWLRKAITRWPGSAATKPWSISPLSAIGNTSVLAAASTRNSTASAMRPR